MAAIKFLAALAVWAALSALISGGSYALGVRLNKPFVALEASCKGLAALSVLVFLLEVAVYLPLIALALSGPVAAFRISFGGFYAGIGKWFERRDAQQAHYRQIMRRAREPSGQSSPVEWSDQDPVEWGSSSH